MKYCFEYPPSKYFYKTKLKASKEFEGKGEREEKRREIFKGKGEKEGNSRKERKREKKKGCERKNRKKIEGRKNHKVKPETQCFGSQTLANTLI